MTYRHEDSIIPHRARTPPRPRCFDLSLNGMISFDIARDLTDPDSFIATEVFEDRVALDRQESLPEVGKTLAVLEESLVAEPEATIFRVSSSEPHGA